MADSHLDLSGARILIVDDVPSAGVNLGNGKVYYYGETEYLRWDIASDQIDPGYPMVIAEQHQGWPISP